MIVRIQLGQGRGVRNVPGKNRHLAFACAALLAPASLMAYVLGFWRLSSDLGMTREFGLAGILSHWQVWIAFGVTLHIAAFVLNRYGRGGEMHLPRVLTFRFAKHGPEHRDDRASKSAKAS
jgi:hypothetical protein